MLKRLTVLIFILFLASTATAGITGKIAGKIVDSETKAPLPGVNVQIQSTSMGAVTDLDGNYVILNVPVGNYQLIATILGYTSVTVQNVQVSIDITTKVNFNLIPEVLHIGEGVTIVAERPLIQKDEVATRHFVTAEEIDRQPVDSFEQIAQNQAGVVGSHFRGGRSSEVLVLIDGIPVRDPAGTYSGNLGGFTSDIPEYGIQELEVSLGGFSAEYGNVQSGILNLALKEGSQKYSGKLRFNSTNFGSPDLNTQLLREIYEININGPEPLTTYLLPKIGLKLPGALLLSLSGEVSDKDRGYYVNQKSLDQSYQGKLTYKIAPNYKLSFGGVFSRSDWDQYYFPASKYGPAPNYPVNEYKFVDNGTLMHYIYVNNPARYEQGNLLPETGSFDNQDYSAVQTYYVAGMQEYLWNYHKKNNMGYALWTHMLNTKTFYEIRLNSFYTNYHYASPDVEDRDHDGNTKEDLVWDITQSGPHPIYRERENNYWWLRGDDPGYRNQSSWTQSVKADLVSQITANHLLKGGLEFYQHRTRVENISWTLNLSAVRKDIWDEQSVDFAAYMQDKLEFEGIIALIGLRYDLFNPNGLDGSIYYPVDYNYPYTQVDMNDIPILQNSKKAEVKSQFSPRIGISHPITDRDVLHFSYGHYFQRPDGYYLYRNNKIQALTKTGNMIGNPNLKPEKTVAFELGVEHQISNDIKITVTGYNKDISNLMDWLKYVGRSIQNIELNVYTNADYGNVKGLEFTFSKRAGRYWGATINYTYSIAKGRSSSSDGGYGSFTDAKRMNILSFDQTHTANATITLRTPENFGIQLLNIKPLANWQANFQVYYGSGLPYSSYGTGKINDKRMPWTSSADVKIVRMIKLSHLNFELFADIFNLFNRKNVDWIGSSLYYETKGDPTIVDIDNVTGDFIRNPQAYSDGRQVRFGLAVQF